MVAILYQGLSAYEKWSPKYAGTLTLLGMIFLVPLQLLPVPPAELHVTAGALLEKVTIPIPSHFKNIHHRDVLFI